jgi:hypothetical protein
MEPKLYEHIKEAASLMAEELQKTKEREKKLEAALAEVFPIELYKQIRPDVEAAFNGDPVQTLEHYIETGINETNIKTDMVIHNHRIAENMAESCLRNINISELTKVKPGNGQRKLSLLKTKGNLSNLQGNQEHNFAVEHTCIHYKSNSVCTWIPKNGCSNLRYSISKENGAITNIEEIDWIHRNNDCFNVSTKEALQADYTFIILRNPFKRLLSFFLDKLCHPEQNESEGSYQHAHNIFKFDDELSYFDFINYIWENPNTIYNDEHTTPQCDFLLYRNYDNYFALEKINEANQEIYKKTGINVEDIRSENSIFTSLGCEKCDDILKFTKASKIKELLKQKKIPIIENMYSNDMIKKVATLYLQDILLYSSEINNGLSELDYWIQRAFNTTGK